MTTSSVWPRLQAPTRESTARARATSSPWVATTCTASLPRASIRPLAIGRKNYLFCGDDDAAQRAAMVYSLLATCKARGVDERSWLEDVLRRIPEYELGKKDFTDLLPGNWKPTTK